jgi:outer membrane protein TolC
MPIDLPTALQIADASNPVIALARERVREAYFQYREAQAGFLPNLTMGPQYNRHDGEIQNSTGLVFATNKWNFFIGGGAALEWDTPNLLFAPLIARRARDAQAAAAQAISNQVQLEAALAYLDLLHVYGQLAVNADTLSRAEEMLNAAQTAEEAQKSKSAADLPRAQSEVSLRQQERIDLTGQTAVASARLARILLLEPSVDLEPADHAVLPIVLVPQDQSLPQLIQIAVANRPELAEGQALAGVAETRLRQARLAPLIPKLDVGYSSGGFGGGIDQQLEAFRGRGDGLAMATWELHGLGLGDLAQSRVRQSQYAQASLHIRDIEAEVAEQVTVAAKLASARQASLAPAQNAVKKAEETWVRLRKASFGLALAGGRFDPLEPLLAEQALDTARSRYLSAVIEFDRAQFQLYWALGQPPLCALPEATAVSIEVPAVPAPRRTGELPQ